MEFTWIFNDFSEDHGFEGDTERHDLKFRLVDKELDLVSEEFSLNDLLKIYTKYIGKKVENKELAINFGIGHKKYTQGMETEKIEIVLRSFEADGWHKPYFETSNSLEVSIQNCLEFNDNSLTNEENQMIRKEFSNLFGREYADYYKNQNMLKLQNSEDFSM